jgi:RHS repeat-associated protein
LEVKPGEGGEPVALKLSGDALQPDVGCIDDYLQANGTLGSDPVFLTPAEWGTIKVSDPGIIPERCYRLETVAGTPEESQVVESKEAVTWKWGDVANGLGEPIGDGLVDVGDVLCAMDSFGNLSNCAAADQQPCTQIDGTANLDDLLTVMSAFTGESFAVTCATVYPPCNEPTPTIPTKNPYYFTGQRLDLDIKSATGEPQLVLYHYRARAYDPIHGRFLQRDVIGYSRTRNLFEYVVSRPQFYLDPSGREEVSVSTFINDTGESGFFRDLLGHAAGGVANVTQVTTGATLLNTLAAKSSPPNCIKRWLHAQHSWADASTDAPRVGGGLGRGTEGNWTGFYGTEPPDVPTDASVQSIGGRPRGGRTLADLETEIAGSRSRPPQQNSWVSFGSGRLANAW